MWISVMREKPEEMQDILIYDDVKGLNLGYYFEPKGIFIASADGKRLTHVSFWMRIPEVPLLQD